MHAISIFKSFFSIILIPSALCRPSGDTENKILPFNIEQMLELSDPEKRIARSILKDQEVFWPNAVVPYEVSEGFDEYSKSKIKEAIQIFRDVSCVKFVPHEDEENYIKFMPTEKSCSSFVGMVGGEQDIWLKDGCFKLAFYKGAVVHEMLHSLGFIHEQMRDDRDCYVKISGIGKTMRDLAIVFNADTSWNYDHRSIMHYKERSYFKGLHGETLGNYAGSMTYWDRMKLNHMYCDAPHYCDFYPESCKMIDRNERFCRANMD